MSKHFFILLLLTLWNINFAKAQIRKDISLTPIGLRLPTRKAAVLLKAFRQLLIKPKTGKK